MTTTDFTMEVAAGDDLVALRLAAVAIATASGLPVGDQARMAVAVTEAATDALVRSGRGRVTFKLLDGEPPGLEVAVVGGAGVAGDEAAPSAPPPDPGDGLDLARLAAERCSVGVSPEGTRSVVMGWSLPARPGAGGPGSAGAGAGGPVGLLDLLRHEDRLLGAVLEDLRRTGAQLDAQRAEVDAGRAEVDALVAELEETNRGVVALYRDLEESRAAEARLSAIVRSSDDAMYAIALDETVVAWNAGAERLLGYDAAEIVGQPVQLLLAEGGSDEFRLGAERLRRGERSVRYDSRRRRKDGALVEVAVALSAIREDDGRLIGYSAVLRDLTRRREEERELAEARASEEVFAERDRIARDLHDLVIQRLFASGLTLQGAMRVTDRPELRTRMEQVVGDLDTTISEIRTAIFALGQRTGAGRGGGVRARLLEVADEAADVLGFRPSLSFVGPVDAAVTPEVGGHLLAVMREALSNVARHAGASRVEATVEAGADVVLVVADDGRGMGEATRRSGLANLVDRATVLGGTCRITSAPGAGTRIEWSVPARSEEAG